MKVRIQKISGTVLYIILAITLVVIGMFYFGGEDATRIVADPEMSQPVYTDVVLYWMYVLLGITIVITVIAAIFQFITNFMDAPKAAIKSLIGLVALVALLIVTYSVCSGEALPLQAYDGTENVPFWLKITDMFLYTIYTLMGISILLILGFGIAKRFK